MERCYAFLTAIILGSGGLQAQTSDVVVFSELGEKFTLVIDGDVKNDTPAARVVATGIRNPTPLILVRLADATLPPVKQNAWMEPGQEYVLRLTVNKKGERVLRMQGRTPIGTPADKPVPADAVDASPEDPGTTGAGGDAPDNANGAFGANGLAGGMTVNDGPASGKPATVRMTGGAMQAGLVPSAEKKRRTATPEPAYRLPGYDGPIGCNGLPMSEGEFGEAKRSIGSKGFEEAKLSVAKQIGRDHCFTTTQVKGIMQLFGFEDSKLDFAKFAYDHTYDIGNYHKVNDVFSFESSVDELGQYIRSR
ncbi:MAG: DUF4476 domain-containing protein [Flavobacteriales bacterium]